MITPIARGIVFEVSNATFHAVVTEAAVAWIVVEQRVELVAFAHGGGKVEIHTNSNT
jgi:hypothetical protein